MCLLQALCEEAAIFTVLCAVAAGSPGGSTLGFQDQGLEDHSTKRFSI